MRIRRPATFRSPAGGTRRSGRSAAGEGVANVVVLVREAGVAPELVAVLGSSHEQLVLASRVVDHALKGGYVRSVGGQGAADLDGLRDGLAGQPVGAELPHGIAEQRVVEAPGGLEEVATLGDRVQSVLVAVEA